MEIRELEKLILGNKDELQGMEEKEASADKPRH